jgi:hypothetical protein
MRLVRVVLIGATALTFAGCALLRGPEAEGTPAPAEAAGTPAPAEVGGVREADTDLERLLAYFQRIRRLAAPELSRENDGARVAFARSHSDFDRLRLAMVLSLPNTAFYDDARLLDLLEPVVKNQNAPLHGLALLVSVFVQEQRRLGQSALAMQQKLDALKSMERSLIEREQAGQKRR